MVYFVRGKEKYRHVVKGVLTGRKIGNKYEIKATDGTFQYTESYKKYEGGVSRC